jgi:type IV pilus assembly protein PilB
VKGRFSQRLMRLVVREGLVDDATAQELLELAERNDRSYEDVLLERGAVDEGSLLWAVSRDVNLPAIDVERVAADPDALATLDQEYALHFGVLPLSRIGNILTLAVSNPFDIIKLDDLRMLTNCELRPVVGTERAIRRAIQAAYNPDEARMETLFQDLEDAGSVEVAKQEEDEEVDLAAISDDEGGSPVVKLVNLLVANAVREGASDIHIEPFEKYVRVRYRKDGVLHEVPAPPKSLHNSVISRIKVMSGLDIAERRIPQDGKFQVRYEGRQIDFRVSILPTVHGEKAVLRILDSSSLNLGISQLGFEKEAEEKFRRAIEASYGMILVTGPTGSGKSTTLYAALKEVLDVEENVVTVEDPVEYQLDGVIQVPVNAKRGLTFAAALRSILRQDPDIVMIGEIRDFETADIAVKAALTGHLVLSTLHTNDAPSAVTRLIDMGIDAFMVSSSVLLIAAQRLCRKLCDRCKRPMEARPKREYLLRVGLTEEEAANPTLWEPVGCDACTNGYRGRFAILEAFEITEAIRRMIIEGKSSLEMKKYAVEHDGMLTLRRCGVVNALRGKTSLEEVLRVTMGDEL